RAHCAKAVGGAGQVDGLAQAPDMDVDRSQFDVAILSPHAVEQLPAREDASWMLHEMAQQAKLGWPEVHDLLAALHLVRDRIELEVGVAQYFPCERGAEPAQNSLDARDEFAGAERLGHIIVGAGFKAAD